MAIAARYAQRALGMKKVAIVDWDVHHGNGTQVGPHHRPGNFTSTVVFDFFRSKLGDIHNTDSFDSKDYPCGKFSETATSCEEPL